MNIEKLNNCFDSMSPTPEQKERMLAKVLEAKPVKAVPLRRYITTAAAAVIAVGVFAVAYSNMNNKGITENMVDTVAIEQPKKAVQPDPKADVKAEGVTENKADVKTEATTENKTLTESFEEAYAPKNEDNKVAVVEQPATTKTNEKPAGVSETAEKPAVVNDAVEKPADTDSLAVATVDDTQIETVAEGAASAGGGGGGGGSSARAFSLSREYTLAEITEDATYGAYVPGVAPTGFEFVSATETARGVSINYGNNVGNYIDVTIVKKGETVISQPVVEAEEIKNLTSQGFVEFALDCGEYFVIYNAEVTDMNDLYQAVITAPCFK